MKKPADKIVFPDSGSLDYGDVSFSSWRRLGKITIHKYTKPSDLRKRCLGATMIVTNKCVIGRDLFKSLPGLKAVHATATGVNNIDVEAARECGVAVTNVAGYSTDNVAQCTLAFILAMAGNLIPYDRNARRAWPSSPYFIWPGFPSREVAGKTLTIVGYGSIGKRVAEIAKVFGMKICISKIPGRKYEKNTKSVRTDFSSAVKKADFLTIHCPLSPLTENLIDMSILRTMKPTAYLINMARGGIVNETDLSKALRKGVLAGAALDVLSQEPPPANHVLLNAPNLILTPHTAWASLEARVRLIREVGLNIEALQKHKKRNRIV